MPEEVRGSVTGGNGERLEVRLGSHSLGMTTGNLTTILLLALIGVLGYLRSVTLTQQLTQLAGRQAEIVGLLHANKEALGDYRHEFVELQERNMARIRALLLTHESNQDKAPGERLPLELGPGPR